MMDSHDTNQPLNPGELEEEKKTVEVSETITETPTEETNAEKQPETAPRLATKEEVLVRMKELAQDAENANKQELDSLKQSFYKIHNAEQEAARKLFVENGGSEEDYVPQSDAPMTLEKLKIDPAIATGPFIAITNDIIGMMLYMGITVLLS